MEHMKRTHYCGQPRLQDVGAHVTVCGWVQRQRDLGQLIFVDLRDRTGILQLAFDDNTDRAVFEEAFSVRSEFVLAASGILRERASKNPELPTGDVELEVSALTVLARSETPPFEIVRDCGTGEAARLMYRYLDLRRPDMQEALLFRHKAARVTRDYFDRQGFIEIETPTLIRSTPEGARDFLVPSRKAPGAFYALPQSPQLYKQLSMVAGFDRYFQMARCYRDEDQRADRQPEFTQIDLEMSFADMEDIMAMMEGYMAALFRDMLDYDLPRPLPRLTYGEAMSRYGSDKPDTRYAMELIDLTDAAQNSGFAVFDSAIAGGGSVRGILAKNCAGALSRKEIDKLTDFIKGIGGKGLAWVRLTEEGGKASFSKFIGEDTLSALLLTAGAETGDVLLIVADTKTDTVLSQLGLLRTELAKKLDLIPKDTWNLLWITEFPFFEYDETLSQYIPMHHAFTAPMDESLADLETDQKRVRAKAYDLVLNGVELGSGSVRITDPALQQKIFKLLGLTEAESKQKFGFLTDAFRYGAPPHGGMALGFDRLIMLLSGRENLRDVIAFPKLQNGSEPMTGCPDTVDPAQLEELGLSVKAAE